MAAAVVLTVPAVTGTRSTPAPATGTIPATVYVANYLGRESVTPISTTTNQAGTPIGLGSAVNAVSLAATPNGKTVYAVTFSPNRVIPISTATNTAGKPIKVAKQPDAIAITPDGRTAYVAGLGSGSGTVTPIATATNTPGPAIKVGRANAGLVAIAITPDGRTAYVVNDGTSPGTVVPISTATDQAGKPISVGVSPQSIAITPDGKTAYVVSAGTVTPIDVATNKAGPPIKIGGITRQHRVHAGQQDRLHQQLGHAHRDTDFGGHEHGGHPDQDPEDGLRHRDHPGREDGLCRQRKRHRHADLHRH